jgi:hypothetical protein
VVTNMTTQRGQGTVEYLLVLCLLLIALIAGVVVIVRQPEWANKSALVLVAGSLIAGIGWSAKQTIAILNSRAQLLVMELLSATHDGMDRASIDRALKSENFSFRAFPGLTTDALAYLLSEQRIVVANGRYVLNDLRNISRSLSN